MRKMDGVLPAGSELRDGGGGKYGEEMDYEYLGEGRTKN